MTRDERTERPDDAALAQAWRRASREEPPAVVDEAILAAARNDAGVTRSGTAVSAQRRLPTPRSRPRAPWWARWQPLLAAASVAGIAFVLVQHLPPDLERSPSPATGRALSSAPERAMPPAIERDREVAREEATAAASQPEVAGETDAPLAGPAAREASGVGSVAAKAEVAAPAVPERAVPEVPTAEVAMPDRAAPNSSADHAPPAARSTDSGKPERSTAATRSRLFAPTSPPPAEADAAAADSRAAPPGSGSSVPPPPENGARAPATAGPAATTDRPSKVTGRARPEAAADATTTSGAGEFAKQSTAAMQSPEALVSASDWARRIESLHRAGSISEAATELRRFRAAYDDADRWLAPELQSWAATITE